MSDEFAPVTSMHAVMGWSLVQDRSKGTADAENSDMMYSYEILTGRARSWRGSQISEGVLRGHATL